MLIKGKINLSKIPSERIRETCKGTIVEVDIAELRTPDIKGNTHSIFIYNHETDTKIYLGSGKLAKFSQNPISCHTSLP